MRAPVGVPRVAREDLAPWGGVTQVWAAGSPDARHGVDITATFARGVASLRRTRRTCAGWGQARLIRNVPGRTRDGLPVHGWDPIRRGV